jgi:hypothetical protein
MLSFQWNAHLRTLGDEENMFDGTRTHPIPLDRNPGMFYLGRMEGSLFARKLVNLNSPFLEQASKWMDEPNNGDEKFQKDFDDHIGVYYFQGYHSIFGTALDMGFSSTELIEAISKYEKFFEIMIYNLKQKGSGKSYDTLAVNDAMKDMQEALYELQLQLFLKADSSGEPKSFSANWDTFSLQGSKESSAHNLHYSQSMASVAK